MGYWSLVDLILIVSLFFNVFDPSWVLLTWKAVAKVKFEVLGWGTRPQREKCERKGSQRTQGRMRLRRPCIPPSAVLPVLCHSFTLRPNISRSLHFRPERCNQNIKKSRSFPLRTAYSPFPVSWSPNAAQTAEIRSKVRIQRRQCAYEF